MQNSKTNVGLETDILIWSRRQITNTKVAFKTKIGIREINK